LCLTKNVCCMKRTFTLLVLAWLQFLFSSTAAFAQPAVTLTSAAVPATNQPQGAGSAVIYAVQMSVSNQSVNITGMQVPLMGTYDADDITILTVYFNPTSPTVNGATASWSTGATNVAGPHTFDIPVGWNMAAGSTGYFIVTASISPSANTGHTLKVNGATNPVVFSFDTPPTLTNNQSDAAGTQTIQAATVTLTSSSIPAANVPQGSSSTVVYAVQMNVSNQPVTVTNVQVPLLGTYDADDLNSISVYFNPTAPTINGSTTSWSIGTVAFAGPHSFDIPVNWNLAAGSTGYFIIVVNLSSTANNGHTLKVNGATDPVVFSFATAPNVINNQTDAAGTQTIQAATVTLTTPALPATNLQQGSNSVVYAVQMTAGNQPINVNDIQVPLLGTYDADDITSLTVYFNPTAPTINGAIATVGSTGVTAFSGPHTFDIPISQYMAAGSTGYFVITANISNTANNGHTLKVNGATNPVVLGFDTAPIVVNNQTDAVGTRTIQAGSVTLTTLPIPAGNVQQGGNAIIYAVQMAVSNQPVNITSLQVPLLGTYDADDINNISVYFNPAAATLTGANFIGSTSLTNFAGPHTFNIDAYQTMEAGSSGYFIIVVSLSATANDGHTLKVNGATNPVSFGFANAPIVTNSQTDAAGTQTIQAAAVTLTTPALPAINIQQGSSNAIVYAVQMSVSNQPVYVTNVQVALSGTYDADDITNLAIYFNPTEPTLNGASGGWSAGATNFAAPHTFDIPVSWNLAAGTTGYFIVAATISPSANNGHTLKVNGATNPVVFGFSTAPTVVNNQTDAVGTRTIQASSVTLTSSPVPAAYLPQGSSNAIVYAVQMSVSNQPVYVTNVQVPLLGTYDADDINGVYVYFNPTAPTLNGASGGWSTTVTNFVAPHTFDIPVSWNLAAGSTGYFIIVVYISPTADNGHTIKINGATNPVVFGFDASPNITNNQTDAAGTQTIQAPGITLTTPSLPAANLQPNTTGNIIYAVKMTVSNQPVTITSVQVPLLGTYDADDISALYIYFNPTEPTLNGASGGWGAVAANFTGPHTFNIAVSQPLAAGSSGYFIVVANLSSTADNGHTLKVNGATDPVIFGFDVAPLLTNNQSDAAGTRFIGGGLPVVLTSFTAKVVSDKVQLNWKTASETRNAYFEIEHSSDGISFNSIGRINGRGTTNAEQSYEFLHTTPLQGKNFYRLKQVDVDGNYKYSPVVQVVITGKGWQVQVKENPARSLLRYTIVSSENNTVVLRMVDGSGKEVVRRTESICKGENNLQLPVSGLAGGIYYLQIADKKGGNTYQKLLVQQ
jgi:ketosteroid isomerase-like protein